jgi:hypothetical protein
MLPAYCQLPVKIQRTSETTNMRRGTIGKLRGRIERQTCINTKEKEQS